MFRNYFKTAWRNLVKTIGYSTLNVLGLGTLIALVTISFQAIKAAIANPVKSLRTE